MLTETTLRKPFIRALKMYGGDVTPYVGSKMGREGTSDIWLAHKKWSGWIEFKGPKTPLKPLQKQFIRIQRARLVNALVVRFLDNTTYTLNENGFEVSWDTGADILADLCMTNCLDTEVEYLK